MIIRSFCKFQPLGELGWLRQEINFLKYTSERWWQVVIGFVNLYFPEELFHNISCQHSCYNTTVIMCEAKDNNVLKFSNKMFRTLKILRTGLFFTVILHISNIQCQDVAPAAVVQAAIPGRPTWQFSAQHWKLLELRNLAVNGD